MGTSGPFTAQADLIVFHLLSVVLTVVMSAVEVDTSTAVWTAALACGMAELVNSRKMCDPRGSGWNHSLLATASRRSSNLWLQSDAERAPGRGSVAGQADQRSMRPTRPSAWLRRRQWQLCAGGESGQDCNHQSMGYL